MPLLIATATFGLEATVKRELARLGFADVKGADGRLDFTGGLAAIPRANLWLRSADRVLLVVGEFPAVTFDELFEGTKALPWEEWIPADGKFTVTGKSVKSQLFSVSDCQAIVKKAIVERLKKTYPLDWFPETGPAYTVQVGLLRDIATLTIDTTGPGLHKRGYRARHMAAPIKETLAAALVELSFWRKDRILLDPFCGSGTIPIEAALMARNIAPGLGRSFVSEEWPQIPKTLWKEERAAAYAAIDQDFTPELHASDIDPAAVALARENAGLAGVEDCIHFEVKDVKQLVLPGERGVAICNPPYGERMGAVKEVTEVYQALGRLFRDREYWSAYVITSDEFFERAYGKKADAKRKLFNGMIKTDYYQFYGKK